MRHKDDVSLLRKVDMLFYKIFSAMPKEITISIGTGLLIDSIIGFATKSISQKLLSGVILYHKTEFYWILALGEMLFGLYITIRVLMIGRKIDDAQKALEKKRDFMERFKDLGN